VASLSQGRTAAAQFGLFTYKSVPVIFEPPCTLLLYTHSDTFQTPAQLTEPTLFFGKTLQKLTSQTI